MVPLIVASVIASNADELKKILEKLRGHVSAIQLDFMDGNFVRSHSLDFAITLPACFNYEAHLMVESPTKWIHRLPDRIEKVIAHVESEDDVDEIISECRHLNKTIFLALNPKSGVDLIKPYIMKIDGILIMSVEPGQYGAKFLPFTLEKIYPLRRMRDNIIIEVDGGMKPSTARQAFLAGADIITSGSFLVNNDDIDKSMKELNQSIFEDE